MVYDDMMPMQKLMWICVDIQLLNPDILPQELSEWYAIQEQIFMDILGYGINEL